MKVPLKYNLRHLRVRWTSTLVTVISIALVVAVFVMVMALARGLRSTFLSTGDERNLLVFRKGALAESSSQITIDDVRRTRFLEGIQRTPQGEPLASAEVIVLITLERLSGGQAHVQVRGVEATALALRPQIHLVEGRLFQSGVRECIVSRKVARRFKQCGLGDSFRSGKHTWRVVGVFEAAKTAFESEIWANTDEVREAFRRSFYCSVTLQPENPAAAAALTRRIEADKGRQLRVLTESEYYRSQTKTAGPIQVLGACLAAVMSIGAAFSAMNTMYATVGARAREIGTLRVLGFPPHHIYLSFLLESLALAFVGGLLGCLLSLPLNGLATGTFNWASFAEVAFEFQVTGSLLIAGMAFALVVGALGGLLPARLAARQPLLDALRAT
jgi:ABC-type antimicrobial peptide transport system permease subunit